MKKIFALLLILSVFSCADHESELDQFPHVAELTAQSMPPTGGSTGRVTFSGKLAKPMEDVNEVVIRLGNWGNDPTSDSWTSAPATWNAPDKFEAVIDLNYSGETSLSFSFKTSKSLYYSATYSYNPYTDSLRLVTPQKFFH